MWFDHDGEKILVNTAAHRPKCGWIRRNPQLTILVVNPEQSLPLGEHQVHGGERGAGGRSGRSARVTAQLDKIWTKYTGAEPPYGLRDPAIDEKRVLFECRVDRIATFGKP